MEIKDKKQVIQIFKAHTAACPREAFSKAGLSSLNCGFFYTGT